MPVTIEDILQTNLVLIGVSLINTPEELSAFRHSVGTEVTSVETGLGPEVVNRTHTLNRDRITVTGAPERSAIARGYPAESDLERLAQVAWMAIANTDLKGQEVQAFGYNIELVYEPDSEGLAIQYLAERLFMPRLLQDGGWRLLGGAGRLFFEKAGRFWQARLEPRLNDDTATRIFASLNLHRSEVDLPLPTEADIRDSLKLLWAEAHSLVNHLDESIK